MNLSTSSMATKFGRKNDQTSKRGNATGKELFGDKIDDLSWQLSPSKRQRKGVKEDGFRSFTQWEQNSVGRMAKLVKMVRIRHAECYREDKYLNANSHQGVSSFNCDTVVLQSARQFRSCLMDLNSLLHDVSYFCYCHYTNHGEPDKVNVDEVVFLYRKSIRGPENTLKKDQLSTLKGKRVHVSYEVCRREKNKESQRNVLEAFLEFASDHLAKDDPLKDASYFLSMLHILPRYMTHDLIVTSEKGICIKIPDFEKLINNETKEVGYTVLKPFEEELLHLINFVTNTVRTVLRNMACEKDKGLIEEAFDETIVQFNKNDLWVDRRRMEWEKYDNQRTFLIHD